MIKVIGMLKRREDLSLEEFERYYAEQHMPLSRQTMPAAVAEVMVHFVQNRPRSLGGRPPKGPFDCITEVGFEDEEGLRIYTEWYQGPGGRAVREDEENFVDAARSLVLVADSVHVPNGPEAG